MLPTPEFIRATFDYFCETGDLFWKERPVTNWQMKSWNNKYAGKKAGSMDAKGYWVIKINGRAYKAHRIGWCHFHGAWPEGDLDHKNGFRARTNIAELRTATDYQNSLNRKIGSNNTSGFKGVSFNKRAGKYMVQINYNGKRRHLGYYDDIILASLVYSEAAHKYHGKFARIA